VRVANKTGEMSTAAHDGGIVYVEGRKPYVVVVLTEWDSGPTAGAAPSRRSRGPCTTTWWE
jgi:beta-lactamase class A